MTSGNSIPPLAARPPHRPRAKNLVAVASGKGGVGKTWFSITLAHGLAKVGQHVLLFDGDLGLANVDIQLGLMPKYDLGGVISGRLTLNQAAVRYPVGGFDVIAGSSGSGSLASLGLSRLQSLADDMTLLAGSYDRVVLDLGAGLDKTVRALANQAGIILVVTTDEPTSLTDAYAFIKVTQLEKPGSDIRVVVNMANSAREGERTYFTLLKACESFLKISPPMAGVIRRDLKVREAIRNQKPLLTRSPSSEAAVDVEAIVGHLLKRT
jgi:flagellar biosynthesis protein FlhG